MVASIVRHTVNSDFNLHCSECFVLNIGAEKRGNSLSFAEQTKCQSDKTNS